MQAYEYELYGPKYVTILPGGVIEDPYPWPGDAAPCDKMNVQEPLRNAFYVNPIRIADDVTKIDFNGVVHFISSSFFFLHFSHDIYCFIS